MDLFSQNPEHSDDQYKWTALAVASPGTLVGVLNASSLIIVSAMRGVEPPRRGTEEGSTGFFDWLMAHRQRYPGPHGTAGRIR